MAKSWQIRRDTAANIAATTLKDGELGWTTDNHDLWIGTGSGNQQIGGASGLPSVDNCLDVNITSVADNELLQYDSGTTKWINQTLAEAGVVALAGDTMTGALIIDGANFEHQPEVGDVAKLGLGQDAQVTLGANLDQDDVLIKRDADGASSYSEAGALLTLQRDVTNVTSEDGNFLELQNAAGTALSRFDKDGELIFAETVRLKRDSDDLEVRNLADDGFLNVEAGRFKAATYVITPRVYALGNLDIYSDDDNDLKLRVLDMQYDGAPGVAKLYGSKAFATATTNKVGGNVEVFGGAGDGDAGQEDADGGDVKLYGGAAASDLANSDGGDVLMYAGDHGSSGSEGSVKHCNADGSTVIFETAEDAAGFFAVTPQAQQAHIVDADGQLADITTKFNTLLADLEGFGLLAAT